MSDEKKPYLYIDGHDWSFEPATEWDLKEVPGSIFVPMVAYTDLEAKLTRAREYHESYLKLKYGDDIGEMLQEYDAYVAGET